MEIHELSLSNQANRLADKTEISNEELNTIEIMDFPESVKYHLSKY